MGKSRAEMLPDTVQKVLSDWDLRQSFVKVGQLSPVMFHRGELLDGARRLSILAGLQIDPTVVHIDDRIEAARTLWRVHPRRAYQKFAPVRGRIRVAELVILFGCNVSEIPSAREVANARRVSTRPKNSDVLASTPPVPVPRASYLRAKDACRKNGTSLSAMIRFMMHQCAGEDPPNPVDADAWRKFKRRTGG